MKIVKCRYKNCLHESRELPIEEAVLQSKATYFHKDCFQEKENIKQVIDLFVNHINKNVVFSQLRHVINDIVTKNHDGSGLLLYGLQYYIDHKIPLNYPQGLYYVIQNKEVKEGYEKKKKAENKTQIVVENEETSFNYKPQKQKNIADLVG